MVRKAKYPPPEDWKDIHDAANLISTGKPIKPPAADSAENTLSMRSIEWWRNEGYTHANAICQNLDCLHSARLKLANYRPETSLDGIRKALRCTRCTAAGRYDRGVRLMIDTEAVPDTGKRWSNYLDPKPLKAK